MKKLLIASVLASTLFTGAAFAHGEEATDLSSSQAIPVTLAGVGAGTWSTHFYFGISGFTDMFMQQLADSGLFVSNTTETYSHSHGNLKLTSMNLQLDRPASPAAFNAALNQTVDVFNNQYKKEERKAVVKPLPATNTFSLTLKSSNGVVATYHISNNAGTVTIGEGSSL